MVRWSLVLALLVLYAAASAACTDRGRSGVIVQPAGALTLALSDTVAAAYGDALDRVAPSLRRRPAPTDAAGVEDVRAGRADAALVALADAAPAGLTATEVERRPVRAIVPFSFPLEAVTSTELGELTFTGANWRTAGGPAGPVELALSDGDALRALFAIAPEAGIVAGSTPLVAARGRLLLTTAASGGALSKSLRVDGLLPDDAGYPFAARWALVARPGHDLVAALGRALAADLAANGEAAITLDAVGDIMLGREVGRVIAAKGPSYPFDAVAPLLAGADLRFGNLELPLTERGVPARKDFVFRAPASSLAGVRGAGFSVLSLANNHILDYGVEGLLDTLAAVDAAGIARTGAGADEARAHAPAVVTVRGVRIAFLAYVRTLDDQVSKWRAESMRAGPATPGVAWGATDAVRRDVAAARAQADLVVVAVHAGWEYSAELHPLQRELAQAAVDAGAALVLGAHPHVLQGIELYRGVPIVYSLGNFVFDLDDDDRSYPGLPSTLTGVLRIRLNRTGVLGLELRPAVIDQREGRPLPVRDAAARPVYDRIYGLTDALNGGR